MDRKNAFPELQKAITALRNGDTLTLKKDFQYDVWQDCCEHLEGYHASNTATVEENPRGKSFVAICLQNKKHIVIDGNGATLMIHGIMTPFLFDHCTDITVKNLIVDYARPTMNEYLVEFSEPGHSILKINEDCLYEIKDNKLIFCGEKDQNGESFWRMEAKGTNILSMYCDPKSEHVHFLGREVGDRFPSIPTMQSVKDLGKHRVEVFWQDPNAMLPANMIIQTRDVRRLQLGGLFQYCKNLRLEALTIRFMHGFGLLCQYCENITYNRLNCTPSNQRTIACNADFFHFSGCKGHILIENCIASGAHDDFVNVHGTHLRIMQSFEKENRILVRFENPNTWGLNAFLPGDRVDLIKGDTLLPYATRKVKEVARLNSTDFYLTFNKKLPEIDFEKDAVENVTWTPRLTVRNNRFGPSMGRGILCSTRRRIQITDNIFYKTGGSVLYVASDCNFWMESGLTTNVRFQRNTLINCAYGPGKREEPHISIVPEVSETDTLRPVHKCVCLLQNRVLSKDGAPWRIVSKSLKSLILKNNFFETWEESDHEESKRQ